MIFLALVCISGFFANSNKQNVKVVADVSKPDINLNKTQTVNNDNKLNCISKWVIVFQPAAKNANI